MKKILIILLVIALSFAGCIREICVKGVTRGALERKDAVQEIENYVNKMKNIIGKENDDLVKVGHQLGNYEEYPKFPGNISYKCFKSNREMNRSFNDLNLGGVELDIQLGPDRETLYIVHEKMSDTYGKKDKKWEKVKCFYENNTFELLLEEFIRQRHYEDKYLYIELKAKKAYFLEDDEQLVVEKALHLITVVINRNTSDEALQKIIREHIAFVSFNYLTLQKIIESRQSDEKIIDHKLYYIAASNKIIGKIISCFCPELNNPDDLFVEKKKNADYKIIWSWVNESDDLTGIWLSPNVINNVVEKLNNINEKRKNEKLQQFEFFLSTYQYSEKDFFDVLESQQNYAKKNYFYQNIKGIIFDVKK